MGFLVPGIFILIPRQVAVLSKGYAGPSAPCPGIPVECKLGWSQNHRFASLSLSHDAWLIVVTSLVFLVDNRDTLVSCIKMSSGN